MSVFGFPGDVEKEQSGHIENGKGKKQEHGRGSVRYAKVKTEGSYLPELQVDLSGYCCCLLIGERQSVFLSQAGRQAGKIETFVTSSSAMLRRGVQSCRKNKEISVRVKIGGQTGRVDTKVCDAGSGPGVINPDCEDFFV